MEITDFNSLIQVVEHTRQKFGGQIWWRGLSNSDWDLIPRVCRGTGAFTDEHNYAMDFRNHAEVRYGKCPDYNDAPRWLPLMQHYGLPTRLLDWTESCLIGLFFAVHEISQPNKPDVAGALWGLSPAALNENQGYGLVVNTAHGVETLCNDAFQLLEKKQVEKICAISSPHFDPRQLMQASVFTIHGITTALNKLPDSDKFIEKHIISIKAKKDFPSWLDLMGINEKFIFPDLEHLANYIAGTQYR